MLINAMNRQPDSTKLTWFLVLSLLMHVVAGGLIYNIKPDRGFDVHRGPYVVNIVEPEEAEPPPLPEKTLPKPAPMKPKPATIKPKPEPVPMKPKPEPAPPQRVIPYQRSVPLPGEPEVLLPQGDKPVPARASRGPSAPEITGPARGEEKLSDTPGFEPGKFEKGRPEGPALPEPDTQGKVKPELFDKEVIAGVVRGQDEPASEETPKESSITFQTEEYKFVSYMNKLRNKIENIWHYPPEALRKGVYGDLYISFVIKKDGSLGAVELERTSGHRLLDKAAIKALQEGAPYWPLPESWDSESLSITGHFIYSLYGMQYLR